MLNLLRRFSGAYRRYFIIGPLAKLVEACFDLITPLVVASMIDNGIGSRDMDAVVRHGVVLVLMAVVGISITLICQKVAALASQGMGTDMRRELYAHINRLSFADLDRFGTPSLITRITNDVNQVQLAIALSIRMLIRWPFLAVGSMVAAMLIDARLGLIFLVCTPLIAVVFWVVMAKSVPYFKSMQAKLDHIGLVQREALSGARVVRAFSREEHERERFARAADDQALTAIAVGRLSSVLNPVTFLVMNLGVCAILWSGAVAVNVGDLTQGQVIAFVNYMTQTLLSIVYVANMVVVFTKASASAARINQVLACDPSITDIGAAQVVLPAGDVGAADGVFALDFEHVSFRYGSASADALSDISLRLPVGGTLGIIGGTGSGKSTLVSLLPRLYDADRGRVEVFGTDVRDWPLRQLRGAIGVVPQTAQLLAGTIRSNLTWRDADAVDEELWHALEVAQAADFVRALPDGLDAAVEAGGKNFSGGQRQRLTIARALVGDPKILVLDDSSSALDLQTDAKLRRALRELAAGSPAGAGVCSAADARGAADTRGAVDAEPDNCSHADADLPLTTVIVSQRVSSVRDASLICVMRRGRIVGLGTHEELLATCGVYREICDSQLKREEVS